MTNNNLNKNHKQERRVLSEYLQEKFNNRQLLFSILVSDNPTIDTGPQKTLTTPRSVHRIQSSTRWYRELKDKLKLGE